MTGRGGTRRRIATAGTSIALAGMVVSGCASAPTAGARGGAEHASVTPSGAPTEIAQALCAAELRFRGRWYDGSGTRKPFALGAPIGRAWIPACSDHVVNGTPAPARPSSVRAVTVVGIDPADAIADPADSHTLYIARSHAMPAAVRDLVEDPRCDGPSPATVTGTGQLNYDTSVPYPVLLRIEHTDKAGARYLHWFVTLHVTARTAVARGTLATLQGRGPWTITAVVACRSGHFVATSVRPGG